MKGVIDDLRRAVMRAEAAGLTDSQLLELFLERREEAAFEELVRRHAPMILGVCRRVLHHTQDAEDAFQATFLILMRKAGSIHRPEVLGAWLYGVAYRVAVRAKAMAARRRAVEGQVGVLSRPNESEAGIEHDLDPLLDREVNRLPAKYRVPLVCCDLEGRSRKQAARQLGLPEGTLSSRLARARALLKKRLTRQGVTVGSMSLATVLSQQAVRAFVPAALVSATVKAATLFGACSAPATAAISTNVLALAKAGFKALLLAKLKVALVVLLAAGLLGVGMVAGTRLHRVPGRASGDGGAPTHRAGAVAATAHGGPTNHLPPDPMAGSVDEEPTMGLAGPSAHDSSELAEELTESEDPEFAQPPAPVVAPPKEPPREPRCQTSRQAPQCSFDPKPARGGRKKCSRR
jgi:RNA polymerase sigma-70 factor (ECF subfamily)